MNSIGQQGGSTRVALQSDGKIVVAGAAGSPQLPNGGLALVRLNSDGTFDTTLGTAGVVTFGVNNTVPIGVLIQTDGKILVGAGTASSVDGGSGFSLARLNSNGSADSTFGTGGVVNISPFGFVMGAALGLQTDGKILMAGTNTVARFDSNGQLDSTFGSGGLSVLSFFNAAALALQSDGKILIASIPDSSGSGTIARFNTNGSLDTTFGIQGQVSTLTSGGLFGTFAQVSSVSIQSDGKFIVAGAITRGLINPPGQNLTGFGLIRYNSNGSVDTTFGTRGGTVTKILTSSNATAFALAIQSNGDIVAAGQAGTNFALARYTSTGKLDTTFGSGGSVTTSLGSNAAAISSLAVQTDGKIVAAGSIFSFGPLQFQAQVAVARYLGQ